MKFRKFSKFSKSGSGDHSEVELPLAPMASVFTVILVYLIKSATMNVTSISPSTDVSLPEVTTVGEIPDALKIEVSSSAILVGEKTVLVLDQFVPQNRGPASAGSEDVFLPLQKALQFEKGELKEEKDSKLVIIADKAAPYQLLKRVMSASANVGYLDLKLVVIGGE